MPKSLAMETTRAINHFRPYITQKMHEPAEISNRLLAYSFDQLLSSFLGLLAVPLFGRDLASSLRSGVLDLLHGKGSPLYQLARGNTFSTLNISKLQNMLISGVVWFTTLLLITAVSRLLYYVAFESSPLQATPGKKLLGLKVVNTNGQRPTPISVLIRFLLKFIPFAPLIGVFLFLALKPSFHSVLAASGGAALLTGIYIILSAGFWLTILLNKQHRGWHDQISNCIIIQEDEPNFAVKFAVGGLIILLSFGNMGVAAWGGLMSGLNFQGVQNTEKDKYDDRPYYLDKRGQKVLVDR